jgi:hypothetical protein
MDEQGRRPEEAPACSRCSHSAESHIHDPALSCARCALGPLAHAMGIGCSFYTPRTWAFSGASCREPGCGCGGYDPDFEQGERRGTTTQELFGGCGRQ